MSIEPGLTYRVEPGSNLLRAAADAIVALEPVPDLSGAVVIVPNLYVVQPLQRALQRAAHGATLLLPKITTLALWAETIAQQKPPVADSRRLTWIYDALRRGDWFPRLDLWQVAVEILGIIDECARHGVALPENSNDFQRVVRQALRASDNRAIQFEAKLVHELWRALQRDGSEIDCHGAYRLRLAELAARADAHLYVAGLTDIIAAEEQFLQRYAQRQPVLIVRADTAASAAHSPLFALLQCAWDDSTSPAPLMARAAAFAESHSRSPAASLRLFAATSLEHEAIAVELTLRRWLHQGKRNIAIIAQDRLTARRARARLERAKILVADESGWTLSTTTAASAAMRLLDVVSGDFYFRDLLDFLRSPFILADRDGAERRVLIQEFEALLLAANYVGGSHKLRSIMDRSKLPPAISQVVMSLMAGAQRFGRKPRPLSGWVRALIEALRQLGAIPALGRDAAGMDLLRLLQTLAIELEGEKATYNLSEWRRWFDRQLENANFRDLAIESSVVLTHLGLTDGRGFDGVILLGADADHLPSPVNNDLFNDAVLRQLGLPSRDARHSLERQRLMQVLAGSDAALITWQAAKGNEPNPPSPYWARLTAFHRVAYGDDLADSELLRLLEARPIAPRQEQEAIVVKAMPRPSAPALVPASLSASDYASLIDCPYQFFVRRMLALRQGEEVAEAMEKKDYGELVHRVLAEFHHAFPVVSGIDEATLQAALRDISTRIFQVAPEGDYFARAWRLRWERYIPAYLAWQREREAQGWRWQASEVSTEAILQLASGKAVGLRGRLDRVDRRRDESGAKRWAVLDYKTGNAKRLKDRAADPDEDSQLPFYGMIADPTPSELGYVGLDSDPIATHTMAGEVETVAMNHRERLRKTLEGIAMGEGLAAQGIVAVCNYCEAGGVCRKRFWELDDDG